HGTAEEGGAAEGPLAGARARRWLARSSVERHLVGALGTAAACLHRRRPTGDDDGPPTPFARRFSTAAAKVPRGGQPRRQPGARVEAARPSFVRRMARLGAARL
ncbi:unnamed protein product, partial [Urochloa humidicola]